MLHLPINQRRVLCAAHATGCADRGAANERAAVHLHLGTWRGAVHPMHRLASSRVACAIAAACRWVSARPGLPCPSVCRCGRRSFGPQRLDGARTRFRQTRTGGKGGKGCPRLVWPGTVSSGPKGCRHAARNAVNCDFSCQIMSSHTSAAQRVPENNCMQVQHINNSAQSSFIDLRLALCPCRVLHHSPKQARSRLGCSAYLGCGLLVLPRVS